MIREPEEAAWDHRGVMFLKQSGTQPIHRAFAELGKNDRPRRWEHCPQRRMISQMLLEGLPVLSQMRMSSFTEARKPGKRGRGEPFPRMNGDHPK